MTMMIRMPDFVTEDDFTAARAVASDKKALVALPKVRLEPYAEGLAAQIMHIGPYSEEAENIKKVHDWIKANGYARDGKHHEIYLSDPNRTAPEKLKTIVRQPMRKAVS